MASRRARWMLTWTALSAALWLCGPPAVAQLPLPGDDEAKTEQQSEEPALASPAERRAQAQLELAEVERSLERARAEAREELTRSLIAERDVLERIVRWLDRQVDEADRAVRIEEEREEIDRLGSQPPQAIADLSAPVSLLQYDQFLDRRHAADETLAARRAAANASDPALQDARRLLDERERARRRLKEELERSGRLDEPLARSSLRLRQLESRAAQERVRLREKQAINAEAEQQLQEERVRLLDAAARWARAQIVVDGEQLDTVLDSIRERQDAIGERLEAIRAEREAARAQWQRARERLESSEEPPPALVEETRARRLAWETAERNAELLERESDRLAASARIWEQRFEALTGQIEPSERIGLRTDLEVRARELDTRRTVEMSRLQELRQRLAALDTREAELSGAPQAQRWIEQQRNLIGGEIELIENHLAQLDRIAQLAQRTLDALEDPDGEITLLERVGRIWQRVLMVWNYELYTIDDSAITVSKIVKALILILIGYFVSRWLSRALGNRVFPRFGIDAGANAAFQTIAFYLLFVVFFLYALRWVNIPLTVFTVVGGALAIGIGFGSQNIVNNFISGLILMAERPIKVGDLIDVDSTMGNVEAIGARSTRIKAGDNTHIIVPNSAFLEKNVVNWTLSDDQVRAFVDVGVAYGSPTRDVAKLMIRAAGEHGKILDRPAPEVLFLEFGDNALAFRLYFWIQMGRPLERLRVESDIRFRIDHLFRDAGITIAFPQRDVHLDTLKPLEVRVLERGADEPDEPTG